jgi:hypothetical protein
VPPRLIEAAGGAEVLMDAIGVMAKAEVRAVAVEDRLPDRRADRTAARHCAAAAGLQLQV